MYVAEHLVAEARADIRVDVYDRLATPWGLVRSGVAPDHPKIKSVTRRYEEVLSDPRVAFWGNVEVGKDLTPDELAEAYDAVVYAVGASVGRPLGIPGEQLPGSWSAADFVAWYNGHPDHSHDRFELDAERVAVIGNGNVALDVARMLALPAEELAGTDIADHALAALRRSRVREVVVVGRRGPAQAAFTSPELRELGDLDGVDVVVDPDDAAVPEWVFGEGKNTAVKRNVETIQGFAGRGRAGAQRRIILRFHSSPEEIVGRGRVAGVVLRRNRLVRSADGKVTVEGTEARETLDVGMVVSAVGYVGRAIPGLPFDDRRGVITTQLGRVLDTDTDSLVPGVYATGWIKRGPSGVIGSNKRCAKETADSLVEDLLAGRLPTPRISADQLAARLAERFVQVVGHDGWRSIDRHEQQRGRQCGRPRVKLVRREDLLAYGREDGPAASSLAGRSKPGSTESV
jgi:ferredoxin--NADP+ reductase